MRLSYRQNYPQDEAPFLAPAYSPFQPDEQNHTLNSRHSKNAQYSKFQNSFKSCPREFERCPPVRLAFVDLVDQLFLHIERLGQDALAESVKQSVVVANLPAHQVKRLVIKEPSINVSKGSLSGCLKIEDSERPFV